MFPPSSLATDAQSKGREKIQYVIHLSQEFSSQAVAVE